MRILFKKWAPQKVFCGPWKDHFVAPVINIKFLFNLAAYHSTGGPLTIEEQKWVSNAARSFLKAGEELGYEVTDPNADKLEGKFKVNIKPAIAFHS